jgi:hypothetical protein
MNSDAVPEPWGSFLRDLDRALPEAVALHCIGGFAVSLCYGLERPTGDIDVVEVIPNEAKVGLATLAGRGSSLHRQHKLYLQIVTVASLPYCYEDRLTELFPATFERLRLLVPDPHDLALSKLARNLEVDFEDVKYLAKSGHLDLAVLDARYAAELRPYLSGPPERHDQSLRLWIAALRDELSR